MRSRICFWINHCFISCSNNTYLKRYKICFLIFMCTSRKCVNYSVVKLLSTQCLSHVRCHRERRRPVCKGCFGVCSHQSSLLRKALFGLTLLWSLKISLCFDPGPGWDLCHEICQRDQGGKIVCRRVHITTARWKPPWTETRFQCPECTNRP